MKNDLATFVSLYIKWIQKLLCKTMILLIGLIAPNVTIIRLKKVVGSNTLRPKNTSEMLDTKKLLKDTKKLLILR